MFQVGLPCYLGLNSGRSVSINVKKTRKQFSRNNHGARMFPQCSKVSHKGNIVSSASFCFQDANYAYTTQQGILTQIQACEHLQKFCEYEQASTHLIFCEQFEQRPNFPSTFKLDGIIRYPSNWCENMLEYLSLTIICFSMLTVFAFGKLFASRNRP